MQRLKLHPAFLYSLLNHLSSNSARPFCSLFSTVSLPTTDSKERTFLINYLNANVKFSNSGSIYISKHISGVSFPQKPLSVLNFFKQIGFSEAQVQSMIRETPQLLFSDVDKTLRPKIEFFQLVGFEGSDLCRFISKNSTILTCSLKKTLAPSVEAVRKIVYNEKDLIQVLHRCGWILLSYQRFVRNVAYLESCGIVGSQLTMLLKQLPRLFTASEYSLRKYVLHALDMGFQENSRMLVYALYTLSCLSYKTFSRKLELIQCFGFSKDESLQMFKKCPSFLRTSEKKLKIGIEFFLHTVMLPKSVLVLRPMVLMYSFEDRVLPRYRVWQLLISKNLCKMVPSFINVLLLPDVIFMDKYISRFGENAESLLVAYKGHYPEA